MAGLHLVNRYRDPFLEYLLLGFNSFLLLKRNSKPRLFLEKNEEWYTFVWKLSKRVDPENFRPYWLPFLKDCFCNFVKDLFWKTDQTTLKEGKLALLKKTICIEIEIILYNSLNLWIPTLFFHWSDHCIICTNIFVYTYI